ncbi:MAG: PD-(D/E)XK nuclease family protein [Patescibacteria group bacterium]
MRTSYSALDTFKTCPLKYKYQAIDKLRAPKRIEAVFGTLLHSALKYMFLRNPLYPTADEVIDYFTKAFNEKSEKIIWPDEKRKESDEKAYFDEGVKLIKNFYHKNQPWNFNALELESRFALEIPDEKEGVTHTLAGIIDRIDKNEADGSYEIIDYKTGKKMPAEKKLAENLQLNVYHLALVNRWPSIKPEKIKISLYFLKHNEKISATPEAGREEKTKKALLTTIREIEDMEKTGNFPPTPGPLCDWCGFRKMCPMWSHEYKKPETPSDEEAAEAIREYFAVKSSEDENKKKISELRGKILTYMDSQKLGRVFGGEGYITKTIQERVSFDIEKIKPILEKLGLWNEVLAPDMKKLQQIINTLPDSEQEVVLSAKTVKSFVTLKASKK